jgi:hypothetical protein
MALIVALVASGLLGVPRAADAAIFQQEGPALFAPDQTHDAELGASVTMSADGTTALVGGPAYKGGVGAVWVYIRSGPGWKAQAAALTPNDATGVAYFGASVAISADGNTVLVGGWSDNSQRGAAWVFTRSGSTWKQQGVKLLPNDLSQNSTDTLFGHAVALSADGATAVIGAEFDNYSVGAVWVFTRSGSTWSQQGPKITAAGEALGPDDIYSTFGASVGLSADGRTLLVGAPHDNAGVGATWVFTRQGTGWTQGPKLTGGGENTPASFGTSVALAADGKTALVGGGDDGIGAAWIFAADGQSWTQQGPKLTPTDESGSGHFGDSVSLSSNGNVALVGADQDNGGVGAAWVFERSGPNWAQQGSKLRPSAGFFTGYGTALSADGQTAMIGTPGYRTDTGSASVFGTATPTAIVLFMSFDGQRGVFGHDIVGSVNISDFSEDLNIAHPTGTVTTNVYGPNALNCDGPPTAAVTVPVDGDGSYQTGPLPITQIGTYQEIAFYSGDAANYPTTSDCYPALTIKADIAITPTIGQPDRVGTAIRVDAAVSGAVNPTGSVTFQFYGPTSPTCIGTPEATQTRALAGNGSLSLEYVPTAAGTYHMTATFPGDDRNYDSSVPCTDAASAITVQRVVPSIVSTVSAGVPVGSPISDAVQLVGGFRSTGAVTLSLFSPSDASCSGEPAATVTARLVGGGASSGAFATAAAGRYRFVATYSGDENNAPVTAGCGSTMVEVGPRSPNLSATGFWSAGGGGTISDRAAISDGFNPTGFVTFLLYGPGDPSCHGKAAFKAVIPVAAAAAAAPPFGPVAPGGYRFLLSYSGDANNSPTTLTCGKNSIVVPASTSRLSVSYITSSSVGIAVRLSCASAEGTPCRGVIDMTTREVRRRGRVVVGVGPRSPGSRLVSLAHAGFKIAANRPATIQIGLDAAGRRLRHKFALLPTEVTIGLDANADGRAIVVKRRISLNKTRPVR